MMGWVPKSRDVKLCQRLQEVSAIPLIPNKLILPLSAMTLVFELKSCNVVFRSEKGMW